MMCFLEGLQRIVLFTDDERVFNVKWENEKAELAAQEVTIALSNVGISLVNNYCKQEVCYIGITRQVISPCFPYVQKSIILKYLIMAHVIIKCKISYKFMFAHKFCHACRKKKCFRAHS